MQKPIEDTTKLLLQTEEEVFKKLVPTDHAFRKLRKLIHFGKLTRPLKSLYSELGQSGIAIEKGFKALLVQFWEDYSDREMENAVRENIAIRWFCGFGLTDTTPDHSYFGKLRKRIGPERLADMFNAVNAILQKKGLFGNVFTFIDASSIVSKTALWEERDEAIKDGEEKLNNANVEEYAADPDARWGAKGKDKIWYGYKRHHSVDMRFGLINKLCVTPANVLDFQVINNICPKQGMVFCDKLYDCKKVNLALKANNCFSGVIMKNNNTMKNRGLDSWRSKIRMPFEGNFSKLRKRTKFKTQPKVFFQCTFEAIVHNLKKAITVLPLKTV